MDLNTYIQSGNTAYLESYLLYLFDQQNYHDIINMKDSIPTFKNPTILLLLARSYASNNDYINSANIFKDLFEYNLTKEELNEIEKYYKEIIPFIKNQYIHPPTTLSLLRKAFPIITFSITTCKRLDLFEKTMNSFLHCCLDHHLIYRWICVDDNSSLQDRKQMMEQYPFMEFYWKSKIEKGHAQSMNIILNKVKTPFLFHMEDDWCFFHPDYYLSKCLSVLHDHESFGQCLINRNYSETESDNILGGQFCKTDMGIPYYIHDYTNDMNEFYTKYGSGSNCAYWPHYSLRPGMNKMSSLLSTGTYNTNADHFEMDFAYKYVEKGYKTCFLNDIRCIHIGRLTKDRDLNIPNAYDLNDEQQFIRKVSTPITDKTTCETVCKTVCDTNLSAAAPKSLQLRCIVINLDNRKDRYESFQNEISKRKEQDGIMVSPIRFSAINGNNIIPSRYLEHVFNDNDYSYRCGMIGCALSHITLWTNILKHKDTIFLILEDDITFTNQFVKKFQRIFNLLNNKDYDLIMIGYSEQNDYRKRMKSYNTESLQCEKWDTHQSLLKSCGGTFGYIINQQGALKMLQFIQKHGMTNCIDTMIQKACDSLNIYYCTPQLVESNMFQYSCDSDIQQNHNNLKRSFITRLKDDQKYYTQKGLNITICNKTTNDYSSPNVILYCSNNCSNHGEFVYKIENTKVYISDDIFNNYPELRNIGLIKDGMFSVQNILGLFKLNS